LSGGGQPWVAGEVTADDGDLVELAHLDRDPAEGIEETPASVANNGLDAAVALLQRLDGSLVKGDRFLLARGCQKIGVCGGVRKAESPIAVASANTTMVALCPVTTPSVFPQSFNPAKRALFLSIPPSF
jgi:hypothetical protein